MSIAISDRTVPRFGAPAPLIRLFGWGVLAFLGAFLVANVLIVGWGAPGLAALWSEGRIGAVAGVYALAAAAVAAYVALSPMTSLRWDAHIIHRFNLFVVRACFWAVFLIGVVDTAIAFLRAEQLLAGIVGDALATQLGLSRFVGPYVHGPLILAGIVLGLFTRTLGVHWLALLTVLAELLIVISRFGFSYEQAFMGDLVRYWYAGLFLFASAYTLHENGHVRVDVFYAGMSTRRKGIVNAIGAVALGIGTCALILSIGLNGPSGIINSSVRNFEVSQVGQMGMFTKFHMAVFLAIFAVTMIVQFVSSFFEAVADMRDEPGRRESAAIQH
jgi:TRAP-type mannitol/chloroaromatic compound transport system permease small subunit